jgi:hypothetical protein
MKVNGGFQQNGFNDLQKWAAATGYEQQAKKLAGTTFQKKLFSIPSHIDITDPHQLTTNSLLFSFCNTPLHNKGIDIKKNFKIDVGRTDFFGNTIPLGNSFDVGICELK